MDGPGGHYAMLRGINETQKDKCSRMCVCVCVCGRGGGVEDKQKQEHRYREQISGRQVEVSG